MKLYYTPNSPYARICRITAIESGLGDALELDWVGLRTQDSPVIPVSPLGRIPLLVDGDLALSEARHICAYLDEKSGKRTVAPYGDWQAVAAEAQSLALLDVVTVWSREMRRAEGERSGFMQEVADIQVRRGLDHLNATVKAPAGAPPISFDALCVVAALGMMQFYALVPDWRESYPALAAWSDAYDTIASVADSAPSQDALRPLTR
ncbi:glutathione S-transferase family protein [Nisaea nitritireducens]|uniref:glutathione S-transferase family protein n=1 Tax=Nisaea nitritireducens TaxID=568392 RepID=UPI0018677CE2|nr:glutathione S-transferase family protein [Nisaea nitritireducens]